MRLLNTILFSLILCFSTQVLSQETYEPLPCLNRNFSIVVHIAKDSFGLTNITEAAITAKIEAIEPLFEDICVTFEICEFRYIENFQYDDLELASPFDWDQLQIDHHANSRINMFFVTNVSAGGSFATIGGIGQVNSGGLVILKTDGWDKIAHEMGHYFGLFDTNEGSLTANPELVDGSNCATAGDLICDTPADPYYPDPFITWVDFNNEFIYMGQDANGDYFIPHVENVMSQYPGTCEFTYQQYLRMANTYLVSNPKMW